VVLAVALVVVLAALSGLALVGCGNSGPQADPKTVLSGSATAMQNIKGFHFVYEVHKPGNAPPGSGLQIARITGDVNLDGNMVAAIDVTNNGVPLTLDFVQVGDTQYLKMGQWQKIPVESSPVGKLSLGTGTITILQQVVDAKNLGQEKKGGTACYHITGSVAAEAVKAIAQSVDTSAPFPTDLWVGVDNGYVYEVDVHGPATADEPSGTWRSIILSKHDVLVDIKAPI